MRVIKYIHRGHQSELLHCRKTTKTIQKLLVTRISSSMTHHETQAFEMPGFALTAPQFLVNTQTQTFKGENTLQHLTISSNCVCLRDRGRKRANTTWASPMINTSLMPLRLFWQHTYSSLGQASTACWAQWVSQQRQQVSRWCTQPWTHRAGCGPKPWQQTSTPLLPGTRLDGEGRVMFEDLWLNVMMTMSNVSWILIKIFLLYVLKFALQTHTRLVNVVND